MECVQLYVYDIKSSWVTMGPGVVSTDVSRQWHHMTMIDVGQTMRPRLFDSITQMAIWTKIYQEKTKWCILSQNKLNFTCLS